jgi:excisionase family DNA binding protein
MAAEDGNMTPDTMPSITLDGGVVPGHSRAEAKESRETSVPALLTVVEACQVLRIGRWMLYRLIHTRRLETVKIGRRRLIPAGAIQELVERLRAEETV